MLTDTNNIKDIDLDISDKQKFRINGDNDKILELNVSDISIISRLYDTIPKLRALADDAANLETDKIVSENDEDSDVDAVKTIINQIQKLDTELRKYIDYIFDSNVSEVCASKGTMFDLSNGKYRYEHIIETLMGLYEENIKTEYTKTMKRVQSHTSKYTTKKKRK